MDAYHIYKKIINYTTTYKSLNMWQIESKINKEASKVTLFLFLDKLLK